MLTVRSSAYGVWSKLSSVWSNLLRVRSIGAYLPTWQECEPLPRASELLKELHAVGYDFHRTIALALQNQRRNFDFAGSTGLGFVKSSSAPFGAEALSPRQS